MIIRLDLQWCNSHKSTHEGETLFLIDLQWCNSHKSPQEGATVLYLLDSIWKGVIHTNHHRRAQHFYVYLSEWQKPKRSFHPLH